MESQKSETAKFEPEKSNPKNRVTEAEKILKDLIQNDPESVTAAVEKLREEMERKKRKIEKPRAVILLIQNYECEFSIRYRFVDELEAEEETTYAVLKRKYVDDQMIEEAADDPLHPISTPNLQDFFCDTKSKKITCTCGIAPLFHGGRWCPASNGGLAAGLPDNVVVETVLTAYTSEASCW